MKAKTTTVVVSSLVLLGIAAYLTAAPRPAPGGFAKKVAGTYVLVGEIGGGPFEGLIKVGADGTMAVTNTNCCGGAEPGPQGPGHGAWVKTGPQQITMTAVIYTFLPDGTPFLTARPTFVVDFDGDFKTASSPMTIPLFAFGQDVTDPDAIPLFGIITGSGDWSRIDVLELLGLD